MCLKYKYCINIMPLFAQPTLLGCQSLVFVELSVSFMNV